MGYLHPKWDEFLKRELSKEYMIELLKFVKSRRSEVNVYPSGDLTFNALVQCPYDDISVVILGQDPYHSVGVADGLAFSSQMPTTPPSLKNIYEEIYNDVFNGNTGNVKVFEHNDLSQWSWQGVLLLNTVLTADEGKAGSHKGKGWEKFTEAMLKFLNNHNHKLVFMLWGKDAQQYATLIDGDKHLILTADHPAAALYNESKWFGNKHFSKANNWIKKHYFNVKPPISWAVFTHTQRFTRKTF